MALVGIELVTHVSEPDALTTQPPPCAYVPQIEVFFLKSLAFSVLCYITQSFSLF